MPRRRAAVPILVVLAAVAFAATRQGSNDSGDGRDATVVHVVDGDTIGVLVGGNEERVRYIGVDTPESHPRSQCFAAAATELNAELVAGRRVRLVSDVERRDRYGRLLAYVYRENDGLLVNAELVRRGYARTLTIPPNVRFAPKLAALAREAHHMRAGLWSAC